MDRPNKIIIFDNSCVLCNTAVRFIFKFSKNNDLYFTHFDSNYFKSKLNPAFIFKDVDSIVFINDDSIYYKSNAIINILKFLKSPFHLLSFLRFLPNDFRDSLYDLIAKNRYKIFGKTNSCKYDKKLADKILS